jgi:phage tail sheath protein FI
MDLCAATREHFALLSVPLDWDAARLAAHVADLRAHAARDIEAAQATSFVALYHPWLLQREADASLQAHRRPHPRRDPLLTLQREADASLHAHPPEGAVLGVYAKRSRDKGAWSAAGLDPLAETVGLATVIDPEAIEGASANAIELRPRGIAATRAATLSEDQDWTAIGVRRLFILLRRLARREGERYAFEPNDFTLRRSLERSFDALLQRLMQRGAFRGASARDSYALRTASGARAADEIERGECSLEIRVAPSRPLRFLTLRVVRAGEQLLIEER